MLGALNEMLWPLLLISYRFSRTLLVLGLGLLELLRARFVEYRRSKKANSSEE